MELTLQMAFLRQHNVVRSLHRREFSLGTRALLGEFHRQGEALPLATFHFLYPIDSTIYFKDTLLLIAVEHGRILYVLSILYNERLNSI